MRFLLVKQITSPNYVSIYVYVEFDTTKQINKKIELHLSFEFNKQKSHFLGHYQSCRNKAACIYYILKHAQTKKNIYTNFINLDETNKISPLYDMNEIKISKKKKNSQKLNKTKLYNTFIQTFDTINLMFKQYSKEENILKQIFENNDY
jgi:hypothetical protein